MRAFLRELSANSPLIVDRECVAAQFERASERDCCAIELCAASLSECSKMFERVRKAIRASADKIGEAFERVEISLCALERGECTREQRLCLECAECEIAPLVVGHGERMSEWKREIMWRVPEGERKREFENVRAFELEWTASGRLQYDAAAMECELSWLLKRVRLELACAREREAARAAVASEFERWRTSEELPQKDDVDVVAPQPTTVVVEESDLPYTYRLRGRPRPLQVSIGLPVVSSESETTVEPCCECAEVTVEA